jgi:hypothetical protein
MVIGWCGSLDDHALRYEIQGVENTPLRETSGCVVKFRAWKTGTYGKIGNIL